MTEQPQQPAPSPQLTRPQLLKMTLLIEGGMLFLALLIAYPLEIQFWQHLSLNPRTLLLGTTATLPMLTGVILLHTTNWKMTQQLHKDFQLVIQMFRKSTITDIAFISIMAGLCEEALFRGLLQNLIANYTTPAIALILASLIFGIFHLVSLSYAIFVTIIGIYLGGLYLLIQDLTIPIIAHTLYDFIALLYALHIGKTQDKH